MAKANDCKTNFDPLKLIREGSNQEMRNIQALNPEYAPVDEHGIARQIVFAEAISGFITYYNSFNTADGNWSAFFNNDPSFLLATAAIRDIEDYKSQIKSYFSFLNNLENETNETALIEKLSYIFSCLSSLGKQLDTLVNSLPNDMGLKLVFTNLFSNKLAPALKQLIAYHKAGSADALVLNISPSDSELLPLKPAATFASNISSGFSSYWIIDNSADWNTYYAGIAADASVYGNPAGSIFDRCNHIATHSLFTSVSDQFLMVYARFIKESLAALEESFTNRDDHDPHYALFISFLRLKENARTGINTLTQRHLDFYYREVLQLREKPALAPKVHLVAEPAKHVSNYLLPKDELLQAGKDAIGKEAFFANSNVLVINQSKVASLFTVYRHSNEKIAGFPDEDIHHGRVFASAVSNSDDGSGAELLTADKSWHPFYNKTYVNGGLKEIKMPLANIGFGIASHYLLLAEGKRDISIYFSVSGLIDKMGINRNEDIVCMLTGEKGWIEKTPTEFIVSSADTIRLVLSLSGDDAAVTGYNEKAHALQLDTNLPVLILKLKNTTESRFTFPLFENIVLRQAELQVSVDQIKNLQISNDFGPVDPSKPFQPFGAIPDAGSSLVIGSREIFSKKNIVNCNLNLRWKNIPNIKSVTYLPNEQYFAASTYDYYTKFVPWVNITFLKQGSWKDIRYQSLFDGDNEVTLDITPPLPGFNTNDDPSFNSESAYSITSKTGFCRLTLPYGMGHRSYRDALSDYILLVARGNTSALKPTEPYTPEIESITASYTAMQIIKPDTADQLQFENRSVRFMHLTPFGFAEQHAFLKGFASDKTIFLFPQLRHLNRHDEALPDNQPVKHEAEFYIGLTGSKPPQNVSLFIQVADGTANPLSQKPVPHVNWSYLSKNEWFEFEPNTLVDETNGLLKSGIVTLAIPREATDTNSIMPAGMHWVRLAVAEKSDAVCRLVSVIAQGFTAQFTDRNNDPEFASVPVAAGTISKLSIPVSEIKKIAQPFKSFGGRSAEMPQAFYTRVSERLRHKDRAINLWDYEKLILEAFPQVYRVKCLNHTQYEPDSSGDGIYRELAAGHVTVVTIPDSKYQNLRDPLKSFTSLGLLQDIKAFLSQRVSCFVKLHVNNPQFEEVRMKFSLRLVDGVDETFHVQKLQQSIMRFLSPWAFANGGNANFGGKVYKSVLIDFIEEQAYVDYITDVMLFHDTGGKKSSSDTQVAEASLAISVLVSAPEDQHIITVINPSEEIKTSEKCNCES